MVNLHLEGQFDEQLLSKTLKFAQNPVIYWRIAQSQHLSDQPGRILNLLKEGFQNFPVESPPFLSPANEINYRYWLARAYYKTGDFQQARQILPEKAEDLRTKWFKIILIEEEPKKLALLTQLLNYRPDNLIYQWLYSRVAREKQSLGGEHRLNSADFFYQEFQTLYGMNFKEAALAALMRTLELNPTNGERQFELTRYFYERGWEKYVNKTLTRVQELGYSPPERVEDYEEGLGSDTPPGIPPSFASPVTRVFLEFEITSFWESPPGAKEFLKSIFRQAFHHQPAFEIYMKDNFDTAVAGSALMREDQVDGWLDVEILTWNKRFRSLVDAQLADEIKIEKDFYGTRRIKIWRLLDETITLLRENWPWKGKIFRIEELKAWVNLGAVHGITDEDEFEVRDFTLPVSEVYEQQAVLELPTPVYSGYLASGDEARLIREDEEG